MAYRGSAPRRMTTFATVPVPEALTGAAGAISTWAAGEPLIDGVYLFGSRIRGPVRHPLREDSDLDIAVRLGSHPEDQLSDFIVNAERWRRTLAAITGLRIGLVHAHPLHRQIWQYLCEGCAPVYVRVAG